jgi:hypothetical protein
VLLLVNLEDPRRTSALLKHKVDVTALPRRHRVRQVESRQLGVDPLDERPPSPAFDATRPHQPLRRLAGGAPVNFLDELEHCPLKFKQHRANAA